MTEKNHLNKLWPQFHFACREPFSNWEIIIQMTNSSKLRWIIKNNTFVESLACMCKLWGGFSVFKGFCLVLIRFNLLWQVYQRWKEEESRSKRKEWSKTVRKIWRSKAVFLFSESSLLWSVYASNHRCFTIWTMNPVCFMTISIYFFDPVVMASTVMSSVQIWVAWLIEIQTVEKSNRNQIRKIWFIHLYRPKIRSVLL